MARVKGGLNAKKKHNRVLKLAKGYRGARSKQYRVAKQSVMRALTSSYAGRKERKRQFRQLWIARINAAARINGLSYSKFMYGLKQAGIECRTAPAFYCMVSNLIHLSDDRKHLLRCHSGCNQRLVRVTKDSFHDLNRLFLFICHSKDTSQYTFIMSQLSATWLIK